ncbi:MAG TPA: metal-dependent hydrolase [Bryobacteraceae bacterium]|nr:metal-dependent hydrolase [Bryobacteraceae bacterium]
MDNITHALTGVLLERAGLGKLYPKAAVLMILAANVPDIDIVAASGGALNYLHYHRSITHSALFLPVMALLPVLLICAIRRSFHRFWGAWLISCLAVASHLILDWTNDYGIRLLYPFSGHWFRADICNVIDLWIWAFLLLGVLAPPLSRLVSSEIGAKPGSGRGLAILGLLLVLGYDGGRALLHQRALEILNSRIYAGAPPRRTAAVPEGSNPLAWKGIVEGTGFTRLYDLNLAADFDPDSGEIFYQPDNAAAIAAARRTRAVRTFLIFCQYPIWTAVPASESVPATRVEVRDARFPFRAGAIVDSTGHPSREWFRF